MGLDASVDEVETVALLSYSIDDGESNAASVPGAGLRILVRISSSSLRLRPSIQQLVLGLLFLIRKICG